MHTDAAPRLARGVGDRASSAGHRHATKTRRRPRALGRPHGPRAAELDRRGPKGRIGEAVLRTWGQKLGESALQKFLNAQRTTCQTDDDCPFTKNNHSCRRPGSCEAGARGAPEARGKCLEGTCALLSEKTHVYDVANRPWLLPYVAERATGGDRAFLVALIRHASAEDPDDRPSFAELVGAIDRRLEGATLN